MDYSATAPSPPSRQFSYSNGKIHLKLLFKKNNKKQNKICIETDFNDNDEADEFVENLKKKKIFSHFLC